MDERRAPRGFPVLGLAAAGMVLGHWLAYVIAIPVATLRARILADSGHSYWTVAVEVAVGMAAVGLGVLAARHLVESHQVERTAGDRNRLPLALRLSTLQVALFTVVEVAERIMARQPVTGMFHHRVFLIGLVIQCLVALAAALFLGWFSRVAARAAMSARGVKMPRLAFSHLTVSPSPVRPVPVLQGAAGLRGPPSR
jgi:hypothetical protein